MTLRFHFPRRVETHVHLGACTTWAQVLTEATHKRKVFLITDTQVAQYCLPILRKGLSELVARAYICTLPSGEATKRIETCTLVWQQMTDAQLNRDDLVIVLGGGVVCDLGGFCAATFKRGLECILIPTTLLSMVDSSIGGKVGVDFQHFKNLLGTFTMPSHVFINPEFLHTLPEEEILSGMAEVLKHCAIGDRSYLGNMQPDTLTQQDWATLIPRSLSVKTRVVQRDPLEHGLRKVLNFGHTIGHALETYMLRAGTPIPHGCAVGVGMYYEMQVLKPTPKWAKRLNGILNERYLKYLPASVTPDLLQEDMRQDKKNTGDSVIIAVPGDRPFTLNLHVWDPCTNHTNKKD